MKHGLRNIECQHCGRMRDEKLSIPCVGCGSRMYPFPFRGYHYPEDVKPMVIAIIGLVVVLLIGLVSALVVYTLYENKLNELSFFIPERTTFIYALSLFVFKTNLEF